MELQKHYSKKIQNTQNFHIILVSGTQFPPHHAHAMLIKETYLFYFHPLTFLDPMNSLPQKAPQNMAVTTMTDCRNDL